MIKRFKFLLFLLSGLLLLLGLLWSLVWINFGGGENYPDRSTNPILPASEISIVAESEQPFGNLAVSTNKRLFFTIHPESNPKLNKLMELKDDTAVPYPSADFQRDSLVSPLGLSIDQFNRLWVIDHGNHATKNARVLCFDLSTDKIVYYHEFPKALAPLGSYFNDIQISNDGRFLFISDVSAIGQDPAIVIHDTQDLKSKRRLAGTHSVKAEKFVIQSYLGEMKYFLNSVTLKLGVDGLVLGPKGQYLYFAAMNNYGLYRIPIAVLDNFYLSDYEVNAKVEFVSEKVLSDGLSIDQSGTVFMCDIEHSGIAQWSEANGLETLVSSPSSVRWADGMCFGPDTCLYFTDSALPDLLFTSDESMKEAAPYYLYKIQMTIPGFPGR